MSKSKITGKTLVIQLGRKETQIVLVGKGAEILHGAMVPTPAGAVEDGAIRNADAVRDMLKSALKAPEFKRVRQVVFAMCTSQVITETVTTPALPNAKLEKLLQSNMDMYFPVDVHDYQMVWQVIGPKEGDGSTKELLVQLWAVPINMLKRYYAVANDCGLSVAAIDYCGHSIATAVGASYASPAKGAKSKKKLDLNQPITFGKKKDAAEPAAETSERRYAPDTDLYVLLERDLLGMTFVQNGQVILQRSVRCGATPSYQFGELSMMLDYFRSMEAGRGSKIRGIACGFFAPDTQLIEELADALGISFTRFAASYEQQYCLCAGAAGTDLDFGNPTFNAPGKTRTDIQGQLWQYAMILAGGLAVIAVFMFILSARIGWDSEMSQLQSESQILSAQAAKYSGFSDNYDNYKNAYDAYSSDWNTVFGSLHATNNNLVRVMEELEEMLPENSSVLAMQIGSTGMNITLACEDKEEAAYVIREMRDMKYIDCNVVFSDLAGGGKGPAKTYGTQGTEAPPAEGSSVTVTIITKASLTADNIVQALSKGGSLESISLEDLGALYDAYGKAPNGNSSYSDVIGVNTDKLFDKRVEAMNKMFDENPFAVRMLMEALSGNKNEIMSLGYAWDMMVIEPNINKILDFPEDLKGAREYKNKFERVFYQTMGDDDTDLQNSPARLADTERLLAKDSELAQTYTYYLALVQGGEKEDYPYMNVDAIAKDLEEKNALDTTSDALDKKLNGLIWKEPEQTQPTDPTPTETTPTATEPVATTPSNADLKLLIDLYLLSGGSGNDAVDALLGEYAKNGKVSNDAVKDVLSGMDLPAEPSNKDIESIADVANDFFEVLENGNIKDGQALADMVVLFQEEVQYILNNLGENTGATEDSKNEEQLKLMLQLYLLSGGTGNDAVDALLQEYVKTGKVDTEAVKNALKDLDVELTDEDIAKIRDLANDFFDDLEEGQIEDIKAIAKAAEKFLKEVQAILNKDGETTEPTEETVEGTETTPTIDVPGDIVLSPNINPQYVAAWLKNYVEYGDCGLTGAGYESLRKEVNAEMLNYFSFGTNNPMKITNLIDALINAGTIDAEVKAQLKECYLHDLYNNSIVGKPLFPLIVKYLQNDGSCGNATLDKCFKRALNSIHEDIFGGLDLEGTGDGNKNGSAAGYSDTRVFFTAFLTYGDKMMSSELERKGLSAGDKIAELFTNLGEGEN